MPINTPLEISNCKVWLDMSDLSTLSGLSAGSIAEGNFRPTNNNDLVGFLRDKSNNDNNFTNFFGLTSSRPRLINNAQNRLSVLRFDGVNYLTGLFNLPISAQTTFAVVSRRLAPNQGTGRVYTQTDGGPDTASNNHYIPIIIDGNTNFSSYISGGFRSTISPPSLSSFDVYTSSFSANALSGFVFNYVGGLSSTSLIANPIRRTSSLYSILCSRIGAGITSFTPNALPTTFTFLTGDIGEIIVYDRLLSRQERTSVEWYLANKWNLPLTFFALNSGSWSDESIWSVSGVPLPLSDVFSNGYNITINQNISARGLLGTALSPYTVSTAGTFNLIGPFNIAASISGVRAGTATGLFVSIPNGTSATLSGDVLGGSTANSHGVSILDLGGTFTIFGNVSGGSISTAYGVGLSGDTLGVNTSNALNIVGNIFGRTSPGVFNTSTETINFSGGLIMGGNSSNASGIVLNGSSRLNCVGNVLGGTASTAFGIDSRSTGVVTLVGNISASNFAVGLNNSIGYTNITGNIVASSASNAFFSNSVLAQNILNCSLFNSLCGVAAVFARKAYINLVPNNLRIISDNKDSVFNILSSSETFSTINWSQPFAPVTVVKGEQFNPLKVSTNNVSTLTTTNGVTGIYAIRRHFIPVSTVNTPYSFSIYAAPKPGSTGYLELYAITPTSNHGVIYDISNGTTLTLSPCAMSGISGFDSETNFRKYSISFFTPNNATSFVEVRITTSSSLSRHVIGTGSESIHIWGAQLERALFPKGYVFNDDTNPITLQKIYNPDLFKVEGPENVGLFNANSYSISNLPSIEDVREGITYGGYSQSNIASLIGTMAVPSKTSVRYRTLVDNTSGEAIFTTLDSINVWNFDKNTNFTSNSIGRRLSRVSTTFDVGSAISVMNL